MNTKSATIHCEFCVACSRRAQPVWFRIVKWIGILVGAARFHEQGWSWWALAGLATAVTFVPVLYRWKTETWTRAWGGRNNLEAGRD